MALYGAPVWVDALDGPNITILRQSQRMMAVRVIRGYRTISSEVACMLACTLPWDLDARTLASLYEWRQEARIEDLRPAPREVEAHRAELWEAAVVEWKFRLERSGAGRRTIEAVCPILKEWLDRQHGVLTFRLTQILTGHGCFGGYLRRIAGREPMAQCHHCDGCFDETAKHTLEECPAWTTERRDLCATVGNDLSLPTVVRTMVGNVRSWRAVLSFCETVMLQKEAAEREREESSDLAIRRKRIGRRRAAHNRRLPP